MIRRWQPYCEHVTSYVVALAGPYLLIPAFLIFPTRCLRRPCFVRLRSYRGDQRVEHILTLEKYVFQAFYLVLPYS